MGRRVLVTGLATFWGGRLAQSLEADPSIDVIIGLDDREPTVALERTEFLRTDPSYSILARIVRATGVDTVLHTFLVVDSGAPEARAMHDINVIGTLNLCAAAGAPGTSVRTVVVKSSSLVYGSSRQDPAFFREDTPRPHPPTNRLERSLIEVESYVQDFALDHPEKAVSILRYSNVLGPNITTSLTRALELPTVPCIAGFDPRWHLVHEEDVVRSLRFAMDRRLDGIYNVAGDGLLPWSEIVAVAGKRRWQLPWLGIEATAQALRAAGIVNLTPDLLGLLRYGRGLDTLKLKRAGFSFRYDTAATVADHVGSLRLRRTVGSPTPAYHYEEEVEQFLRRSTAVVREPTLVE